MTSVKMSVSEPAHDNRKYAVQEKIGAKTGYKINFKKIDNKKNIHCFLLLDHAKKWNEYRFASKQYSKDFSLFLENNKMDGFLLTI